MSHRFTFDGRILSVRFALTGIQTMLRTQHNAWIHAIGTIAVLVAGIWFRITALEWCLLILTMMAVWTAEALNTPLELLADVPPRSFIP